MNISEMVELLVDVENAPWDEGCMTGFEIWGKTDPCVDGNYYNYRSAVRHAIAGAETARDAYEAACKAGLSDNDLLEELEFDVRREAGIEDYDNTMR